MDELKECPFSGYGAKVHTGEYPDGTEKIMNYGHHADWYVLGSVLRCTYLEDGRTEEKIIQAWNTRN